MTTQPNDQNKVKRKPQPKWVMRVYWTVLIISLLASSLIPNPLGLLVWWVTWTPLVTFVLISEMIWPGKKRLPNIMRWLVFIVALLMLVMSEYNASQQLNAVYRYIITGCGIVVAVEFVILSFKWAKDPEEENESNE